MNQTQFIFDLHETPATETGCELHLKRTSASEKNGNAPRNKLVSTDILTAMEGEHRVLNATDSGLEGTTSTMVMSGVPGGRNRKTLTCLEFAIAPMRDKNPVYQSALFVTSDDDGHYKVPLSPGTYWVGPKEKALAPARYLSSPFVLPENEVLVKPGIYTHLDLTETGYAP
jgi:hypothetical protein